VKALAQLINSHACQTVFSSNGSDNNSILPVRHALAHIFLAGDEGINGAEAFTSGMSDQDYKVFTDRIKNSSPFYCAVSDIELQWITGSGGSRVSNLHEKSSIFADIWCSSRWIGPSSWILLGKTVARNASHRCIFQNISMCMSRRLSGICEHRPIPTVAPEPKLRQCVGSEVSEHLKNA